MLLTGLVSAANVPVLLASMLAAFILLLAWICCGMFGVATRSWQRPYAWWVNRRAKPPAPPAPPPVPPTTPATPTPTAP